MKKITAFLLLACLLLPSLCCCGPEKVTTGEIGVVRDEEFGNTYLAPTIEEFNALGFAFGDSIDLELSNGLTFTDVPYYSGYYVPIGEMLACGYPGYPHVTIARNYGSGTWEEFGMDESSRVTVTLREKGKYLVNEELFALQYSDLRSDYDSDVEFANFREVKGGGIAPGAFYRSASPCDDQHKRASITNRLTEENGIRFVLNLSDNETKYASYVEKDTFDSAYYDALYREGNVMLLAMNANYRSQAFAEKLSGAFLRMTGSDGPVLIHCVEGKDRTGFACTLLLALAGATSAEIETDYMTTFANYYGVTKEDKPDTYEAVLGNVHDFLYCLCEAEKGTDPATLDLAAGAERYLRWGGLTDDEIAAVGEFIRTGEGGTAKMGLQIGSTRTYVWEKEGCGGEFTVTLEADGSFTYYEGYYSSYIGMGTWEEKDGIVTLYDGTDRSFRFAVDGDDLIFRAEGSGSFTYVTVGDGDRFYGRDPSGPYPVVTDDLEAVQPRAVLCVDAGDYKLYASFEENPAAAEFFSRISLVSLEIVLKDDGISEKAGTLPWTIEQQGGAFRTAPGDVILYGGDRIAVCYDESDREGALLGRVYGQTRESVLEKLGDGDVTVLFYPEWGE